ncbi:hypothetical protein [Coraliomargarita akajimensis]|uniref:Lipoprotein n=1 Tax=Coraliomargarita akajimensis (strain DSM 45221 / IAM 15411 / JCM 23193 / KCTC 12865 / 04OKA010-24) TaxID=583355 RepID=D5EKJ0_CORAD|nr:hypothetical protein [Coraliomargarita akajimensis]ADE53071.1 hypothetical protein Caka_0042 [Coraliomargarita akajimensis DSM 45221]
MNTSIQIATTASLMALALFTSACTPKKDASAPSVSTENSFAAYMLVEAPTNPVSVAQARKQAKPGETIHVSGQIGGTLHPFVNGYASFVLADTEIMFCDEMGDDHCSTPWDACCEDKDKLKAMRLSVQIVDAEGNPLTGNLKAALGVKELDTVSITGVVAEGSTSENVVINATGLHKG